MKYNLVNFCEVNKEAEKAYSVIHNEPTSKNLGDITKVDYKQIPECDLLTHGSPCQDFSVAGKQGGGDEGSGTRSSLIWNSVKIIEETNPKFVIWENVKNAIGKTHKANYDKYVEKMDKLGYDSYTEVLNAKDYGKPQNRERVFCVSIRKDISTGYKFPEKQELTDKLENYIDFRDKDDLTESFYKRYKQEKDSKATELEFIDYLKGLEITGRVVKGRHMGLYTFNEMDYITEPTGVVGTLTCRNTQNYNKKFLYKDRIYRPSPKMCYELMGFSEEDYEKSKKVFGGVDKHLYDRAGNSIVVDVVYALYKELEKSYPKDFKEDMRVVSLFSGIGAFEKALERL